MIGLEKTKARAGEIQQSVKAMTADMMRRLYFVCISNPTLTDAQRRQGIVRYVSMLHLLLLLLHMLMAMSIRTRT